MERFFFRSAQLRCSSLVSFSNFVYSLYFPYMDSCHLLETFIAHPSGYGEVQGSLLALLSIHCVVLEPSLLTESTCYTLHFSQFYQFCPNLLFLRFGGGISENNIYIFYYYYFFNQSWIWTLGIWERSGPTWEGIFVFFSMLLAIVVWHGLCSFHA